MAANLSRGWRGGSPAGRQASLCRGEDYKITSGSSKYHSVQNLSITFSSVSHKGKRLVCCDRKNISPELTKQNKNIGNGRAEREGCPSGRARKKQRA